MHRTSFSAMDIVFQSGEGKLISGSSQDILLAMTVRRYGLTNWQDEEIALLWSRLP